MASKAYKAIELAFHSATPDAEAERAMQIARKFVKENNLGFTDLLKAGGHQTNEGPSDDVPQWHPPSERAQPKAQPKPRAPRAPPKRAPQPQQPPAKDGWKLYSIRYVQKDYYLKSAKESAALHLPGKGEIHMSINTARNNWKFWEFSRAPDYLKSRSKEDNMPNTPGMRYTFGPAIGVDEDIQTLYVKKIDKY